MAVRARSRSHHRIAVAGVLAACAMVAAPFALTTRPPLPAPAALDAAVAARAQLATAVGSPRMDDASTRAPATDGDPGARAVVVAPPVEMRVAVRRAFGDRPRHLLGPLVVLADGRELLRTELVASTPLPLTVPGGCTELAFQADGYEAAAIAVRSGLTSVVLQPRTRLALEVRVPPGFETARLTWFAETSHEDHVTAERELAQPVEPAPVPFVPGVAFRWQAVVVDGARRLDLAGAEAAVAPDASHVVCLDFTGLRAQRHRLVGVHAALLPHVELWRTRADGESPPIERIDVAADGSFEVVPRARATWSIAGVALAEQPAGGEIALQPERALCGIGLRSLAGSPTKSLAHDREQQLVDGLRDVHVLPRDVAVGAVLEAEGARGDPCERATATADVLDRADGVAWLSLPEAPAPALLRVRVGGEPPANGTDGVRIVARAGKQQRAAPASGEVELELLAERSWDLAWALPGGGNAPIASGLVLRPAEHRTLDVVWPRYALWAGEVAGMDALPAERKWSRVAWGSEADAHVLADKPRFARCLLDGQQLDHRWQLFWGMHAVPARLAAVDGEARTFVVAPAREVRWVDLRADAEPPWVVLVARTDRPSQHFPFSTHADRRPLPVARGTAVHGSLQTGGFGEHGRTAAWWSITDGVDALVVRGDGGRTVELRPVAAAPRRAAVPVGPHGQWGAGVDLSAAAPRTLHVPDGTRSIAVFDGDRPRESAREIPLAASDVVTID
jgi:hypothetical protein